jgi:CRISPR-associated Csx10 family RAMP protein
MLYAIDALQEGQSFAGEIWFANKALSAEFAALVDTKTCYIGADRTRGLGRVELTKSTCVARPEENEEIRRRWQFFNQEIAHRTGESVDSTRFFCVTLLSDCIVTDDFLRYQSFIRPEDFARMAQTAGADEALQQYELFLSFTATHLISGWNIAPEARLPKEDDVAIAKGAVFVYCRKAEVTSAQVKSDALPRLFASITRNGIGLRRNEGFGRIAVCDPFHCLREAI